MFINAFLIKLWQKIPWIIKSGLNNTIRKKWPLYKNYYKKTKSNFLLFKPFAFVLQYATIVESSQQRKNVNNYEVEENITHLMTMARLALEKGDTERATAILEMGLKICEEYEIHMAQPYIYDILASISFAMGQMERAEMLLVCAIEKLIQFGTVENDSQIIDFQLRLARIYSAYSENDLAEIGFHDCLTKQKRKIYDGDTSTKTGMLYVNCLFWYGLHKIQTQQHKSAKKLINSAYDYSLKIKGLSPYQEMVILYTLGDLHMQLGENNLALQNLTSAILLGKGIGSTDMPRCYLKLGQIYINLEAWTNARESLEQAIKIGSLFSDHAVMGEAEFALRKIQKKIK